MRDPYRDLAPLYDLMTEAPGLQALYAEWRQELGDAIRSHHLRPRVLVDLACGTGNTAIPWARARRLRVIGVDVSEAMLRVARRKSDRVQWVRQDLTRLRLDVLADVVTCHFDALNHVLDAGDLQRIFDRVGRLLRPGGVFLFDLNTRFMLEWLSTSEKLFHVGPHVFTAYNAFDAATGIATFYQMWFVKQGRSFRRVEVEVRTRSFEDAELRQMLRAAGLSMERVTVQRRLKGRPIRKLYRAVGR
jgi:ubiquinone/menaquinone biosynthesis C-methylase UbiE